MIVMLLLWMMI